MFFQVPYHLHTVSLVSSLSVAHLMVPWLVPSHPNQRHRSGLHAQHQSGTAAHDQEDGTNDEAALIEASLVGPKAEAETTPAEGAERAGCFWSKTKMGSFLPSDMLAMWPVRESEGVSLKTGSIHK